mgnify:CR=1 FL=1
MTAANAGVTGPPAPMFAAALLLPTGPHTSPQLELPPLTTSSAAVLPAGRASSGDVALSSCARACARAVASLSAVDPAAAQALAQQQQRLFATDVLSANYRSAGAAAAAAAAAGVAGGGSFRRCISASPNAAALQLLPTGPSVQGPLEAAAPPAGAVGSGGAEEAKATSQPRRWVDGL